MNNFIQNRVSEIRSDNFNINLINGPKVIMHLVPSKQSIGDHQELEKKLSELSLFPLGESSCAFRWNTDGKLFYVNEKEKTEAYTQVFWDGMIETISTEMMNETDKTFSHIHLEGELIEKLNEYMQGLKDLGVELPIDVFVTLTDVKGFRIATINRHDRVDAIDRDVLFIPKISINSYEDDASIILKPIFDRIWNACGYEKSKNYDKNGIWRTS
jgi:hypothetical protein